MTGTADEQLRLVTDFGELREGVIIVVKPCTWCGASKHRGMLVKQHNDIPSVVATLTGACVSCWQMAPPLHGRIGICTCSVREGRVFRVVDGLDAERDAREIADVERRAILKPWEPVSAGYSTERSR